MGFFDFEKRQSLLTPPADPDALQDELLPTTFDLNDWDFGLFGYVGGGISCHAAEFAGIAGYVTEADVARIPEPATLLLFGTSLIGLSVLSRRKMRK